MRELFRRVVPFSWRSRGKAIVESWRKARAQRRTRRAYRTFSRNPELLVARRLGDDTDAQPVVMCLWRRPARLAASLAALADQDVPGGIRLILWNNDPANDTHYERVIGEGIGGAIRSIELYSSATNIGGAARMIIGRRLLWTGWAGPVIMIDDDQDVDAGFIRTLTTQWRPHTLGGVWAWRMHGDYWDRTLATGGEPATYVGTGGSIVDADLLADDALARRLDGPDLMCEDILLSARAHELGYDVVGIDAVYRFAEDEHDQWHGLADAKSELYAREGAFALFPRGGPL